MKSDLAMILHKFPSCDGITIVPISDVHLGAAECMEKEFREFLRWVADTENVYLTLGGDLLNNALKSSLSNIYTEIYRPREAKRIMTDMLYPVRDRILCGVGGNHEARSLKDSDSDITLDIFSKLDIEHLYRQNIAFTQIRFAPNTDDAQRTAGKRRPSYTLAVMHGAGGGVLTGSSINRNERFYNIIEGVDVTITGHSHKPAITSPAKLRVDSHNLKVDIVPYKQVISSSWLNYGGYALNKQLLPASHQIQTIFLNGRKKDIKITT